jgi:NAD(P)-dependent dehydrogenase (short-subunit alcohol dehydrogenase family)
MDSGRRNAIITGAASGLGRALALRLARDGWNIALCDINDQGSQETLALVRAAGGDGQVEHLDVCQIEQWTELRDRMRGTWQRLDLLVNNAGVAGAGEVGEFSLDNWRWIIDINLWNGIYGCHTFVDWLKANPNGAHIINTASMAGMASAPGMAGYNVSKAGMVSLSETLYAELLPHNVGVTVICPTFFPTNLLKEGRFHTPDWKKLAEKAFAESKFTAEFVADRAVRAMQRKQLYVVEPGSARFHWRYKRLMPQRFLNLVARMINRRPKQPGQAADKEARQPVETPVR